MKMDSVKGHVTEVIENTNVRYGKEVSVLSKKQTIKKQIN